MKPGIGRLEASRGPDVETLLEFAVQQPHDHQETLHLWEHDLPPRERDAAARLRDSAAIHASLRAAFPGCQIHHVDDMNEVYVSHLGARGSDYVFVQRHIDGPFGWVPFCTLLRCLVVIRGSDRVTTVFPDHGTGAALATGQYCWFDYNRDIHYITKSGDAGELLAESRICLKAHYAVVPAWLGPLRRTYAAANASYNRRARLLFLASQNPRTRIAALLGAAVNAGTYAYRALAGTVGLFNALALLALVAATAGHPVERVYALSFVHYALYLLAYTFRAVEPGRFKRDASLFQTVALGLLFYQYARFGLDAPSLLVAAAGFGLSAAAFARLGGDRTYFGVELGSVPARRVAGFPYSVVPHPMIVGKWIGFGGLMLHGAFRAAWWPLLAGHMAFYLVVLCQEVAGWHLGDGYRFERTYDEFARFHQRSGNVSAHLVTTGVGALGFVGLVAAGAGALGVTPAVAATLLGVVGSYFFRYTTPDHVAAMATLYWGAAIAAYLALPPLGWACAAALLVAGTGLQELAHVAFREHTYMGSYGRKAGAGLQFLLHSVLLVPLLCRARFFR